jgi:hypothetical protein
MYLHSSNVICKNKVSLLTSFRTDNREYSRRRPKAQDVLETLKESLKVSGFQSQGFWVLGF